MNSRYTRAVVVVALFLFAHGNALGQGWSQPLPTNTTRTLNGIFSVSSTMTIAVGNAGTIIGTSNGGNTWASAVTGTSENLRKVFVSGLATPTITVVGDNGTILRSTNSGISWSTTTSGTTLDLHDIFVHDPLNGTTMTIVGENGVILWTNNGGTNWIFRLSPVAAALRGVFFTSLLEGFAVGDGGVILHTTNNGNNWSTVFSGTAVNLHHVYFSHADTGWIVGDGGLILQSTDAGATWFPRQSPTTEHLRRVMFTSTTSGTIVGDHGVILRTADAGATWHQQISGTGHALTSVFFTDDANGMVAGERGLVISTYNGGWPVELRSFSARVLDDGAVQLRWETESETQNFGFEIQREAGTGWETLDFVPGHGESRVAHRYAFTDRHPPAALSLRYRLRQIDYDGGAELLPAVRVDLARTRQRVTLEAWPNPLATQTQLQLTLPSAASLRLRVHDITGRVVSTVHDGMMEAGTHVLGWHAADLPAGRYIAVLDAALADGPRRVSTEIAIQK
ncbi:MAG: YCF48-related protein [Bacteroidota bacterium]|jgi:photosystem II stability/assembly factor-like uncharacterized protein|nr:YCF48-related protein [Bacteroidota bacterium]